jgi:hypothetical protein
VSRPGALGHHWTMQSAQDDLKWFYQYREQDWFQKLVYALIDFNTKYAANLEEKLRIRDVKWYCGNGSGP